MQQSKAESEQTSQRQEKISSESKGCRSHKLIIDIGSGQDKTHAIALADYLSKAHQIEILGITRFIGGKNRSQCTKQVANILEVQKSTNLLIYDDITNELESDNVDPRNNGEIRQIDKENNLNVIRETSDFPNLSSENAIDFIIKATNENSNNIIFVCLGGLSNIIKAYERCQILPENLEQVIIVSDEINGSKHSKNRSEAKKFLQVFKNITLVGSESSGLSDSRYLSQDVYSQILNQDSEKARLVKGEFEMQQSKKGNNSYSIDQLAVACAFEPEIIKSYKMRDVQVVKDWKTGEAHLFANLDQGQLSNEHHVKIITQIDHALLAELMKDCLRDGEEIYSLKQYEKQQNKEILQTFLDAIGIPRSIKLTPNLETLSFIVNKYLLTVPYQNFHYHLKDRQPLSFQFKDLVERLAVQKQGGLCFEHCALTYHILKTLGFDVKPLLSTVYKTLPNVFSKKDFQTHAFLMVVIENQHYIVDTGFMSETPSFPLLINFDLDEQLIQIDKNITFKLVNYHDNSELQLWYDNQWHRLYAFERPLVYKNIEQIQEQYLCLLNYYGFQVIRDMVIVIGIQNQKGYYQSYYYPQAQTFSAYDGSLRDGVAIHERYESLERFYEVVKKETGLIVPQEIMLRTGIDFENN